MSAVAAEESEKSGPSTIYRRPLGHDPGTLDPARIRDIYGLTVVGQIFDGLVQFDRTLTITPALAQFWKASRDGLVWTFTLRKGVRFHDGRELTGDDVVYSLTRILDPSINSVVAGLFANIKGSQDFREGRARNVAGLRSLDRYTVQVTLSEASVPFVSVLAVGHAKIVPREVVERDREGFGLKPIGTGPFKFVAWKRGKEIVLTATRDYFEGPAQISEVVWRVFPGEQVDAMYDEFRKGGLEDSPIPTQNYRRILAERRYQYVRRPMLSLRFYGMNTQLKPLDDRRIRQALAVAVNRNAVVEEVFAGRNTLALGILPPGTLGFNPQLRGHPWDPDRARALLVQAGHPGGRGLPPIQIWSSVNHEGILREHDYMRRALEAVGFKAEFHYETDWPQFSKLLAAGKLPVYLYAWFADVPDPDNFLYRLFYSRSPQNYARYTSPAVDELLRMARQQSDLPRRVDLYRRAEQLILDDAPIIPIFHYTYERLFQPYVRSIEVNGLGDPYIPLRKMWLDRKD